MAKKSSENEELEKAIKKQEDVEELSLVDIGLSSKDVLDLVASERYRIAVGWQTLQVRNTTTRATIIANRSVGNIKAAEDFEKVLQEIEVQLAHCVRGIRTIDKDYPAAKARMVEIAAKGGVPNQ